jgi:hypothetical protein
MGRSNTEKNSSYESYESLTPPYLAIDLSVLIVVISTQNFNERKS